MYYIIVYVSIAFIYRWKRGYMVTYWRGICGHCLPLSRIPEVHGGRGACALICLQPI